jgi:hypothetical protein
MDEKGSSTEFWSRLGFLMVCYSVLFLGWKSTLMDEKEVQDRVLAACGGYLPAVEFEILWEKCANDLVGIQRNRERIHSCSVGCRNGFLNSEWIRAFFVWWKWSAGMDLLCWTATFDFSQEEEERRRRVPGIVFQVASIVAVLLACFQGISQQFKA